MTYDLDSGGRLVAHSAKPHEQERMHWFLAFLLVGAGWAVGYLLTWVLEMQFYLPIAIAFAVCLLSPLVPGLPKVATGSLVAGYAGVAIWIGLWTASCLDCTVGHDAEPRAGVFLLWLLVGGFIAAISVGAAWIGVQVGDLVRRVFRWRARLDLPQPG